MTRHRTTHPLLGTALVAVALLMAGCAHSANGGAGRWHGSFKDSCRDASVDGNGNLRASCRNAQGRWERAFLAERSCPSHRAANRDGRLVCEGSGFGGSGGSGGNAHVSWRGPFRDACRDIEVDRKGNLLASCPTTDNRWPRSYLPERTCPSHRAANQDGTLVCVP
jgi:hypothetical protein